MELLRFVFFCGKLHSFFSPSSASSWKSGPGKRVGSIDPIVEFKHCSLGMPCTGLRRLPEFPAQ